VLDVGVDNRAQRQAPADFRLAALAERQHGVVTVRQLRALGLSSSAVRYRVGVGRLHPIHRGVYAVGHRQLSENGRFLAAVAAVGTGAVLSHLAAGSLWGLAPWRDGVGIDVSVTRSVRPRPGIRLHVVRSLPRTDTTRRAGIPVTTPARTLLDLAGVLGEKALARAVHEGEVQRVVTNIDLREQLHAATGRREVAVLRALVDQGPVPTRSGLEDATFALLRRHGFPRPEINTRPPGLPAWVEVDLLGGTPVAIEVDGDRFHATRWRRRLDARKQALLEAAGYRVIRLTREQVSTESAQTVRRIRRALEAAPRR
jgi:predicted transcriptional regulator of viral defense system